MLIRTRMPFCIGVVVMTAFCVCQASIDDVMTEMKALGLSTDDLLFYLRQMSRGDYVCGLRAQQAMRRYYLNNNAVTCNDDTKAGYYIRRSRTSSRWLVFLEGGWYCFDDGSCQRRAANMPQLMSSRYWPLTRQGTGIVSADPAENPYMFGANLVYVPYCSSDSWSGTRRAKERGEFSFMGALIVEEVIRDLVRDHGLASASLLLLAGSSAGGTGVLLNLDNVAGLMAQLAPHVEVRGLADSGWFLDNEQYKRVDCVNMHTCAPTESIQRGQRLWEGRVPDRCRKGLPDNDAWKCFFGYKIYASMKTPVFIVQHLFDEAQITADNVGAPITKEQWHYIHDLGKEARLTLMNVSAVFAPACLSHELVTTRDWHRMTIGGVTLPAALKCWEESQIESNTYSTTKRQQHRVQQMLAGDSLFRPREKDRNRHNKPTYLADGPSPAQEGKDGAERDRKRKSRREKKRRSDKRRKGRRKKQRTTTETPGPLFSQAGLKTVSPPFNISEFSAPQVDVGVYPAISDRRKGRNRRDQSQVDVGVYPAISDRRKGRNRRDQSLDAWIAHTRVASDSQSRSIMLDALITKMTFSEARKSDIFVVEYSQRHQTAKQEIQIPTQEIQNAKPGIDLARNGGSSNSRMRNKSGLFHVHPSERGRNWYLQDKQLDMLDDVDHAMNEGEFTDLATNHPGESDLNIEHPGAGGLKDLATDDTFVGENQAERKWDVEEDSNRERRSVLFLDEHDIHHMRYHDNKCKHHLIDYCGWPQCNLSCPRIRNPFTGEELDFIDLLLQFGLDLSSIANALGMEENTLTSMDHDALLQLLIQQR